MGGSLTEKNINKIQAEFIAMPATNRECVNLPGRKQKIG